MTMADVEAMAERLPWGTPQEVRDKIIALAEHTGAGTVQINFNRGAMPQEMFLEQIRRFARDVLPIAAGAPDHARAGRRGGACLGRRRQN